MKPEDGFAAVFESVTYLSRPGIFTATLVPDLDRASDRRKAAGGAPSVVDPAELRLAV